MARAIKQELSTERPVRATRLAQLRRRFSAEHSEVSLDKMPLARNTWRHTHIAALGLG